MKLQELGLEVASPMCSGPILNSIKLEGGFDGFSATKMDKATTSSCLSRHLILAENWNPRFLQFQRMEPVFPRFPIKSFCTQDGNQVHEKPWKIHMTVGGTPNDEALNPKPTGFTHWSPKERRCYKQAPNFPRQGAMYKTHASIRVYIYIYMFVCVIIRVIHTVYIYMKICRIYMLYIYRNNV